MTKIQCTGTQGIQVHTLLMYILDYSTHAVYRGYFKIYKCTRNNFWLHPLTMLKKPLQYVPTRRMFSTGKVRQIFVCTNNTCVFYLGSVRTLREKLNNGYSILQLYHTIFTYNKRNTAWGSHKKYYKVPQKISVKYSNRENFVFVA